MIDGYRFDRAGAGSMAQQQQRQAVRPARYRDREPAPRLQRLQIGAEARYRVGGGRRINCR